MSYTNETLLNEIQFSNAMDERRYPELGGIDAVVGSTPFVDYITDEGKNMLNSISSIRDYEIPVIKDGEMVVKTEIPSFNSIPANLLVSDKFAFQTYNVYSGVRIYPSSFENNMISAEQSRQTQMNRVLYDCAKEIEKIYLNTMNTRKTQIMGFDLPISGGNSLFSFNTATDTLNISKAAQNETMFYRLQDYMNANELPGNYRILTNRGGLTQQKVQQLKFGAGNTENLQALGFIGMDRMHETGNIDFGSDIFNGFFLRDGSIGVFENYPYNFRMNTTLGDKQWTVSDVPLAHAKMRANIFVDTHATDATSLVKRAGSSAVDSNLYMTTFTEMLVWFRFTVVYRYNQDLANRTNDIVAIKGLNS